MCVYSQNYSTVNRWGHNSYQGDSALLHKYILNLLNTVRLHSVLLGRRRVLAGAAKHTRGVSRRTKRTWWFLKPTRISVVRMAHLGCCELPSTVDSTSWTELSNFTGTRQLLDRTNSSWIDHPTPDSFRTTAATTDLCELANWRTGELELSGTALRCRSQPLIYRTFHTKNPSALQSSLFQRLTYYNNSVLLLLVHFSK